MGRWLARRLIITVVTFVGITMLVFVLMRLAPVDPVDMLLLTPATAGRPARPPTSRGSRADMRTSLGLDQPIPIQYVFWLREAVTQGQPRVLVHHRVDRRWTWSWSAFRRP